MWADQKAGETSGETEAAFRSELLNEARKSVVPAILGTPLLQVEATCVASDHTIHLFGLFPNSSLVLRGFFPSFVGQVCVYRSCDVPESLSSSSPVSDCLHTSSPVSDCCSSSSCPLQVFYTLCPNSSFLHCVPGFLTWICLQIQTTWRWIRARNL